MVAKAGGGAGYSHELDKNEYIENFAWFNNWVDKHFLIKFHTLLGTILICLLIILSFYFQKEKLNTKKK